MTDISVQNIIKAFEEGTNVLDGLTFDIAEGERVGLLGKNGAGKTTLFRILSGALSSDEGDVVIPKHKRIGLISQIPVYPDHYTTEDVLTTAQKPVLDMRARMDELTTRMASSDAPELLKEYDALAFEFERRGGYDLDVERNRVANGLEIPSAQRAQLFATLSGGEKTRVNLARLILEDTDILLLDEPTNHLDISATEWLEAYLARFKGTALIISHDRYFLDHAVTRTIEIANGKAEFYSGNYSFYVAEKQRRYEEQLIRYERERSEAKRLQESADRLHQWGTGNKRLIRKAQAIESRIERVLQTDRPDKDKSMRARFGEKAFRGDEALVLKGLSKSYDDKALFSDVTLTVTGGERIALIGDNGTGKSTLIKILLGELPPDGGVVKIGPAVKAAYLPQVVHFAQPNRTVLDTLVYETNASPQSARNRLGAYKFSGEDVFKRVADLSGGEQSRLMLCMLMNDDINFLVLDEPTNHLDIASREWIEQALEDYAETLLFVSHDRYFINRFATRVWELENGQIIDYKGTYSEYRTQKTLQQNAAAVNKEKRAETSGGKKRRGKGMPSVAKQIERLEREISKLEETLSAIASQKEDNGSDYEKLIELEAEEVSVQTELDEKLEAWADLAE